MATNDPSGVTNVAIIGFGLLGASFGLALDGVPGIRRLCCTRNPAAREWAIESHAADFASDDPAEVIASVGDSVITRSGEGHSVACEGTDTLEILACIVRYVNE